MVMSVLSSSWPGGNDVSMVLMAVAVMVHLSCCQIELLPVVVIQMAVMTMMTIKNAKVVGGIDVAGGDGDGIGAVLHAQLLVEVIVMILMLAVDQVVVAVMSQGLVAIHVWWCQVGVMMVPLRMTMTMSMPLQMMVLWCW